MEIVSSNTSTYTKSPKCLGLSFISQRPKRKRGLLVSAPSRYDQGQLYSKEKLASNTRDLVPRVTPSITRVQSCDAIQYRQFTHTRCYRQEVRIISSHYGVLSATPSAIAICIPVLLRPQHFKRKLGIYRLRHTRPHELYGTVRHDASSRRVRIAYTTCVRASAMHATTSASPRGGEELSSCSHPSKGLHLQGKARQGMLHRLLTP